MSKFTRLYVPVAFLLSGLINVVPSVGVLSDAQLLRLYQVPLESADLSLLLRHRAVLFLIVGLLLIYGAFRPSLRGLAGTLGLLSMVSFVALAQVVPTDNPSLQRVVTVDIVASLVLVVALGLHWTSRHE